LGEKMMMPNSPASYPGASTEYLSQGIVSLLTDALAEIVLNDGKPISVTRAYLDPADYDDTLPAVIVRALGATQELGDGGETRAASIEIAFGLDARKYGDDEFAISVMDRISQKLLENRLIEGRYRLILPLSWTSAGIDQQPYPYWFAVMQATYALPVISDITTSSEL
jgi:hypothetical protein